MLIGTNLRWVRATNMDLAVHNAAVCRQSRRKRMNKAAPSLTSSHLVWNHGFCLLILLSSVLKNGNMFRIVIER